LNFIYKHILTKYKDKKWFVFSERSNWLKIEYQNWEESNKKNMFIKKTNKIESNECILFKIEINQISNKRHIKHINEYWNVRDREQ
jgi:hypothetical protein